MQPVREVGAERTHFRRWQIITFHAQRLRIYGERFYCEFDVIGAGDLVVRIHKHDEFAGGVLKRKAFAFLHVFAVVVEDDGAIFFCDFARAVGRMRVGQQNFIAVAWIRLARDGRQDVVQQRLDVQRRDDETDARQQCGVVCWGQHGASLAKGCEQGKASCVEAQTNSYIGIEIRCDDGRG